MKHKENIYNHYLKTLEFDNDVDLNAPLPEGAYEAFLRLFSGKQVQGENIEPQSRLGEIYTLIHPLNDNTHQPIEYVCAGIRFLNTNLVFKVSKFIELADKTHLPVRTEHRACPHQPENNPVRTEHRACPHQPENNPVRTGHRACPHQSAYIIETNNAFMLSDEQIAASLYEESIRNSETFKRFLQGEEPVFPLYHKNIDDLDRKFLEQEKKIVTPFKTSFSDSYESEKKSKVIDVSHLFSRKEETNDASVASPTTVYELPLVASAKIDLFSASGLSHDSIKVLVKDEPVIAEEYGKNFTLQMNSRGEVSIIVDQEYQGSCGTLLIRKAALFSGVLRKAFNLGFIDQSLNLKALKEVIELTIE